MGNPGFGRGRELAYAKMIQLSSVNLKRLSAVRATRGLTAGGCLA
jgi:hypothetical protein